MLYILADIVLEQESRWLVAVKSIQQSQVSNMMRRGHGSPQWVCVLCHKAARKKRLYPSKVRMYLDTYYIQGLTRDELVLLNMLCCTLEARTWFAVLASS